jgi:hypothetical protein
VCVNIILSSSSKNKPHDGDLGHAIANMNFRLALHELQIGTPDLSFRSKKIMAEDFPPSQSPEIAKASNFRVKYPSLNSEILY